MLIIESQYFPPISVIKTSINDTHVGISLYDNFQKMSFRNRCIIPAANGVISLSVPIKGGREKKLVMKDIMIDQSIDWQTLHWRSVFSAYGRSPWFDHYRDQLKVYYERPYKYLAHWNFDLLKWVYLALGANINIGVLDNDGQFKRDFYFDQGLYTEPYPVPSKIINETLEMPFPDKSIWACQGPNSMFTDLRNQILPKNFQSAEFTKNLSPYPQVFQEKTGFQPNMSIIDLIFCEGPRAMEQLKKSTT
jgi:WbqC-like protein family